MNFNKLKYFYIAAQELNFSKTAEILYVSQSAVSKHISDLEDDFNVKLFVRTNRNLILTPAGKVLFKEIENFYSKEKEIYLQVKKAEQQDMIPLRVGFMGINLSWQLPTILDSFNKKFANIETSLQRINWDEINIRIKKEDVDIGIKLSMDVEDDPLIEYEIIEKSNLALIVPIHHPLARNKSVNMCQLKEESFIMLTQKDSHIVFDYTFNWCQDNGFTPKIGACYDHVETLLMMVHSGAGIAILSSFAPIKQFENLRLIEIEGAPIIDCGIYWKYNSDNKAIELFVEHIKNIAIN